MTVATILTDVTECVSAAVSAMAGNAVLAAILGMGLVACAATLFGRLKRSAR